MDKPDHVLEEKDYLWIAARMTTEDGEIDSLDDTLVSFLMEVADLIEGEGGELRSRQAVATLVTIYEQHEVIIDVLDDHRKHLHEMEKRISKLSQNKKGESDDNDE